MNLSCSLLLLRRVNSTLTVNKINNKSRAEIFSTSIPGLLPYLQSDIGRPETRQHSLGMILENFLLSLKRQDITCKHEHKNKLLKNNLYLSGFEN